MPNHSKRKLRDWSAANRTGCSAVLVETPIGGSTLGSLPISLGDSGPLMETDGSTIHGGRFEDVRQRSLTGRGFTTRFIVEDRHVGQAPLTHTCPYAEPNDLAIWRLEPGEPYRQVD